MKTGYHIADDIDIRRVNKTAQLQNFAIYLTWATVKAVLTITRPLTPRLGPY